MYHVYNIYDLTNFLQGAGTVQNDFILIENVSHEYSNELEYSIKLLMNYIEQLDGDHTMIDLDYIKSFLCSTTAKLFALKSAFYAKDYAKYSSNYNEEYEQAFLNMSSTIELSRGLGIVADYLVNHICRKQVADGLCFSDKSQLEYMLRINDNNFAILPYFCWNNQNTYILRIAYNKDSYLKSQYCCI